MPPWPNWPCSISAGRSIVRTSPPPGGRPERPGAEALAGVEPTAYLAAAVALADLADRDGDRQEAYAALAAARVTLGDLLGPERGRALTEAGLRELQHRWGTEQFGAVKVRYEQQRRNQHRGG